MCSTEGDRVFGLFCAFCLRKVIYWAQIIAVGGRALAKEKGPGDNLSNCIILTL